MRFLAEENQKKNGTKAQQKCNKIKGFFVFPVFGTSRGSAVPLFSRVFGTFDVNTNRTQIGHNGTEKIVLCSERLHFTKRLGICLEKEISERCAERIVHRRFLSDNVRTRTRASGTVSPPFFLRQRARAREWCAFVSFASYQSGYRAHRERLRCRSERFPAL